MSDSYGVPASPSGSHASHDAVPSSPSVSIPNAVLENWGYLMAEASGAARADGDLLLSVRLRVAYEQVAGYLDAQAIETRRAETRSGSVHESAVPEGCAKDSQP